MKERTKRICAISGAVFTALSISLSLLAFVAIGVFAATDTVMPALSDVIPDENGTSALPLPDGGNVDSDVLTPDDTTLMPEVTTRTPAATTSPATTTARPSTATTSPDGTDTGMVEEEGGGILGAIIAVIVVVAIILVVIALIPRKKM